MVKTKNLFIVSLLISVITLLVYLPALQNDFVNWDDNEYVYENPHIRKIDLPSIQWMFLSFHAANWHPLTWLSHAIDYAVWGLDPMGHHLTSVMLHGLNTFLVVLVITRLIQVGQGRASETSQDQSPVTRHPSLGSPVLAGGVTGLLFGLHPLHVESVAWVSERKDVLYAFFFLLSTFMYITYVSTVATQRGRKVFSYGLCLCLFLLSLMSKPMAVTLPAVLIILDVYPFRRLDFKTAFTANRRVLLEKIPFFGLSLASSVITLIAQQESKAITFIEHVPFSNNLLIAIRALALYLYKILWPVRLAPLYPYPARISFFTSEYLLAFMVVVTVTALSVYFWKKQKIWLTVWLFYLVTLLPVLGFIQIGQQSAADRYTYIPSLGIFLLAGFAVARITETALRNKLKTFYGIFAALVSVTAFLAILTTQQIKIWKDSLSLWTAEIRLFPEGTHRAYYNLGHALDSEGFIDKAIEQYRLALKLKPDAPEIHNSLGYAYKSKGLVDKALYHFQFAIKLRPGFQKAHTNLGFIYLSGNEPDKALQHFKHVLQLTPDEPSAYLNVGIAYKSKGLAEEANRYFRIARQMNPALFHGQKTQH